jgi:putative exporter of polyketide antibiotics
LTDSPALSSVILTFVRMIWWFVILGVSTLVVVCVAIALYLRLRRHLRAAHTERGQVTNERELERQTDSIQP